MKSRRKDGWMDEGNEEGKMRINMDGWKEKRKKKMD